MLDSSVQFVLGTVTIDNTPVPNVNPVSGFIIGNLNPGEARTVSFQVVVQSAPNGSGNYINQASIRFEHQVGTVLPPVTQMVESNIVVIPFVPTIEQICETNLNCLRKIPFQCSPCNHLQINKINTERASGKRMLFLYLSCRFFSGEVKNSSILSESSNGMAPFITEMSQSHHARFSSLSIVSCGKRYRTNFAGLPATIAYGGTSFVTTLLHQ